MVCPSSEMFHAGQATHAQMGVNLRPILTINERQADRATARHKTNTHTIKRRQYDEQHQTIL